MCLPGSERLAGSEDLGSSAAWPRPVPAVSRRLALCVLGLSCAAFPAAGLQPAPAAGFTLLHAVELALEHDPNIAIVRSQVRFSEGSLLVEEGRFDSVVATTVRREDAEPDALSADGGGSPTTLESTIGLSRELRTGLVLEPAIDLTRVDGSDAVNHSTVRFTLRQPLLRNQGRRVVAAAETAAERELEAARLDLTHTVSQRILDVASRYWSFQAAQRGLEILEASEESSRRLLESTRKLIAADVVPAAEAVLLEADVAAKEAARIAGEQQLFAARRDLGRAIGLPYREISELPLPAEPLPRVLPELIPPPSADGTFIEAALERRSDVLSARSRSEAERTLEVAAENGLQPRLDLLLTPSYSGAVEGAGAGRYFESLHEGVGGLGTTVALSLSWPPRNREAEGRLIRSRALVEQRELETDLLVRQIGADVPTALNAVRTGAERLVKASEAVLIFVRAVENEQKKLRAGRSTLIDVINQQDRLTAARQAEVSARLSLALALVELRFQTGTLTSEGGEIHAADLTTIPFTGES